MDRTGGGRRKIVFITSSARQWSMNEKKLQWYSRCVPYAIFLCFCRPSLFYRCGIVTVETHPLIMYYTVSIDRRALCRHLTNTVARGTRVARGQQQWLRQHPTRRTLTRRQLRADGRPLPSRMDECRTPSNVRRTRASVRARERESRRASAEVGERDANADAALAKLYDISARCSPPDILILFPHFPVKY